MLYIIILVLLLVFLLYQLLLISACTKTGGAVGDGTTQGTCTNASHKCVSTGECLGN